MKGKDSKKMLTKEEQQDPKKVQNLAPEPAKHQDRCAECGQELPGDIDEAAQRSGKFDDIEEPKKDKSKKLRHGQY